MLIVSTSVAPSPIHGLGVFLREAVRAGQAVSRFTAPLDVQFPREYYESLPPACRAYLDCYAYRSLYDDTTYILTGDHDRYMNHSDTPNVILPPDGALVMVAARDLAAGEELTCDYRTFDADWRKKLGLPCAS